MKAVNLIPAEERRGAGGVAGRSGGLANVLLGLLLGVVVLTGLWALAHHQVGERRSQIAQVTQQADELQGQAQALAPYSEFVSLANQRLTEVDQLVAGRFDWAHAVHELGRVLPGNVLITQISGTTTPAATAGAAAAAGPAMSLTGCTTSQSALAFLMARMRLMDGVSGVTVASSVDTASTASGGGNCPKLLPYDFNVTASYLSPSTTAVAPVTFTPESQPASTGTAGTATTISTTTTPTGG